MACLASLQSADSMTWSFLGTLNSSQDLKFVTSVHSPENIVIMTPIKRCLGFRLHVQTPSFWITVLNGPRTRLFWLNVGGTQRMVLKLYTINKGNCDGWSKTVKNALYSHSFIFKKFRDASQFFIYKTVYYLLSSKLLFKCFALNHFR